MRWQDISPSENSEGKVNMESQVRAEAVRAIKVWGNQSRNLMNQWGLSVNLQANQKLLGAAVLEESHTSGGLLPGLHCQGPASAEFRDILRMDDVGE